METFQVLLKPFYVGPFPQEINEKSVKLAVWAVSLNFLHDFTLFVVDIHQIRLISLFRHFSDHFHHILEQKRVIDLIPCLMYDIYTNQNTKDTIQNLKYTKYVVPKDKYTKTSNRRLSQGLSYPAHQVCCYLGKNSGEGVSLKIGQRGDAPYPSWMASIEFRELEGGSPNTTTVFFR